MWDEYTVRQERKTQCWVNVVPPSTTLEQHWPNIGSLSRVCWEIATAVYLWTLSNTPATTSQLTRGSDNNSFVARLLHYVRAMEIKSWRSNKYWRAKPRGGIRFCLLSKLKGSIFLLYVSRYCILALQISVRSAGSCTLTTLSRSWQKCRRHHQGVITSISDWDCFVGVIWSHLKLIITE